MTLSFSLNCSHWMERNVLNERLMNKDDKNRHFVLLIIDISKHGAKEMGHVKMAGPGFVNDVTVWWPGFVPKNITNKQEPTQQKSTATIVYTVIQHFHNSMTLIKYSRENHPYHCYYCKTTFVLFEEVIKHST